MDPIVDVVLKYLVLPVGAFVWGLHMRLNKQVTEVAVLTEKLNGHERARREAEEKIDGTLNRVMAKLDSIEQALRK